MNLSNGIYLSGFARGGTTWGRRILSIHPDVFEVSKQVGIRATRMEEGFTLPHIEERIDSILKSLPNYDDTKVELDKSKRFAIKAPPNALILSETMDLLPDAKHVFIMRDPRDVLVSHQRTGVAWTEAHKSFDMAAERTATFYEGYEKVKGRKNILLFKFEDVHQNFPETYKTICEFLELDLSDELLYSANQQLSFRAESGRSHEERSGMNRRGVVGDWVKHLSFADAQRFQASRFWDRVMKENAYSWQTLSMEKILKAIEGAKLPSFELGDEQAGIHGVLSMSEGQWENMEAVKGFLRRMRQAFRGFSSANINSTLMLADALPKRVVKTLARALKGKDVMLEINTDKFPVKPNDVTNQIDEMVADVVPIIRELSGNDETKAIVYGEDVELFPVIEAALNKHGIPFHNLNRSKETPVAWLISDSGNTLSTYGLKPGFVQDDAQSWESAKKHMTYIITKVITTSIDDPLSLGFRTCFDDVKRIG